MTELPSKPRLRGVSHEIAAVVFPVLGVVAVLLAPSPGAKAAVGLYTVGVTGMYAASACYHRGNWSAAAERRLRRVDHSMILVGIAATYTPIASIGLTRTTGRVLLSVVWVLAGTGLVIRNVWIAAPRWLVASVYVGVGWTAVVLLPAMWTQLGAVTFGLIVLGGITYSIGALVYSRRRPDPVPAAFGYHEVFHALVIVAGLVFYAAVIRVVLRA